MIYSFGPLLSTDALTMLFDIDRNTYAHYRLSSRQVMVDRIKGTGYWISPENDIHELSKDLKSQKDQSHTDWLIQNIHYFVPDPTKFEATEQNVREIWNRAFQNGWVRFRIAYDAKDMSQPIADISADNIEIIKTLPESIKDIIAATSKIEFIQMPGGIFTIVPKEDMESVLGRQRIAAKLSAKIILSNRESKYNAKS
jgi:hypothetical protein